MNFERRIQWWVEKWDILSTHKKWKQSWGVCVCCVYTMDGIAILLWWGRVSLYHHSMMHDGIAMDSMMLGLLELLAGSEMRREGREEKKQARPKKCIPQHCLILASLIFISKQHSYQKKRTKNPPTSTTQKSKTKDKHHRRHKNNNAIPWWNPSGIISQ